MPATTLALIRPSTRRARAARRAAWHGCAGLIISNPIISNTRDGDCA